MSELDLLKVHAGKETTGTPVWGTPVVDTVRLMDVLDFSFEPQVKSKVIRTRAATLANGRAAMLLESWGKFKLKGVANYEDMHYWIEGTFGIATPGGAGPYTRAYTAPTTPAPAPRTQTLYYGDAAGGVAKLTSAVVSKLSLHAEKNAEATYEIEGFGKQIIDGASFTALSDHVINYMAGNDFLLYVDAWGGTIGTTAVAATFYSFDLEIDTKRDIKRYLGALNPGGYAQPAWEAKLKMHLEFNAVTSAYLTAILAATATLQRQVRLKATQSANLISQWDFAGSLEEAPKLWPDEDGVAAIDLELTDTNNSGLGSDLKVNTTNSVAVLP